MEDALLVTVKAALERADWQAAHAEARAVVDAAPTAMAWELLGTAAWWLDEAPELFEARTRAYQLYSDAGDRRSAARVATCLADDHRYFRGEVAIARGWLRRATRQLDGVALAPEHGWLHLSEGDLVLTVDGAVDRARRLAAQALAVGSDTGSMDLEMAARALAGLVAVRAGEVDAGMALLDEAAAAATAGELTDPHAVGYCLCTVVMACERARELGRAASWCEEVRTFCEPLAFDSLFSICRIQHAGVLLLRGDYGAAERELSEGVAQLARRRPPLQEEGLVRLAELRRRQGRLDEAHALLARLGPDAGPALGRAELALERGEAASAVRLAERMLRRVPDGALGDRYFGVELLVRARLALGDHAAAATLLPELDHTARAMGTAPLRGTARLAQGLVAAAVDGPDRARPALEDAVDHFVTASMPFEEATARASLAACLAAAGDRPAARAELARSEELFTDVGARRRAAQAAEALRALDDALAASSPTAADALAPPSPTAAAPPRPDGLTPRELEVLALLAQGHSNQEIAAALFVSEFTVKRHVSNILARLDLPTRAAAAAYAARHGIG